MQEDIKCCLLEIIKNNPSNFTIIIKHKFPDLYKEINNLFVVDKFSEKLYIYLHGKSLCKECGNPTKFDGIQNGYREFCSNKCVNKSSIVKQRIVSSFVKKYGVKNVSQNQSIKEKKQKTFLDRYGVKTSLVLSHVVEKGKKAFFKWYSQNGARRINELRLIKRKLFIESCISGNRLGDVIPLFDYDSFTSIKDKNLRFKCKKCNFVFSHHLQWGTVPICKKCNPSSKGEGDIKKFIEEELKLEIICDSFDIIPPYQLDIYIPQYQTAVEYDGLYWHNDEKKPKYYHLNKTKRCEKQGIKLIHIFEDEWLKNQSETKELIKKIIFNNYIDDIFVQNKLSQNEKIILDRRICNKINLINLTNIKTTETSPSLINRDTFKIWDCGKLILEQQLV